LRNDPERSGGSAGWKDEKIPGGFPQKMKASCCRGGIVFKREKRNTTGPVQTKKKNLPKKPGGRGILPKEKNIKCKKERVIWGGLKERSKPTKRKWQAAKNGRDHVRMRE